MLRNHDLYPSHMDRDYWRARARRERLERFVAFLVALVISTAIIGAGLWFSAYLLSGGSH